MELWFYVQNMGDGSVAPVFFATWKQAVAAEEKYEKDGGDGWAESSVGSLDLTVLSDGSVAFVTDEWDDKKEDFVTKVVKLKKKK